MADTHCDLPLLRGFLPFRAPRGSCELRAASPSLWFAIVGALGFRVTSIRCPDPTFAAVVSTLWPGAAVLAASPRRCNVLPDVIFSDLASLPRDPRSPQAYWDAWSTPHVFFCVAGDSEVEAWGGLGRRHAPPPPPRGWVARSVTLTHCEAGGGTSGRWTVVAWYPPACPVVEPAPLEAQPWFPIRACVNDRVAATPVPAVDAPVDLPPVAAVVRSGGFGRRPRSSPGGVVQAWGLFPASDLSASVMVAASGSPSGWGTRSLSVMELAALWDVPILVSDSLSDMSDLGIFKGFWASAPGKVLFAGTDALLTTSFRGGSYGLGGVRKLAGPRQDSDAVGPRPDSDTAIGLARGGGVKVSDGKSENDMHFDALVVKGGRPEVRWGGCTGPLMAARLSPRVRTDLMSRGTPAGLGVANRGGGGAPAGRRSTVTGGRLEGRSRRLQKSGTPVVAPKSAERVLRLEEDQCEDQQGMYPRTDGSPHCCKLR